MLAPTWFVTSMLKGMQKDIAKNGKNAQSLKILQNFVPSAIKQNPGKKVKLHGAQGWDYPNLELGPSKLERAILDVAMPVAGDAASMAGNMFGTYNTVLGAALAAIAARNKDKSTGVLPDSSAPLLAAAAGLTARGGVSKIAGDTVANRLYTLSDSQKAENAEARRMAYSMNGANGAPASFWNTQSPTVKHSTRGRP